MTAIDPTAKVVHIVGLNKANHGRPCLVHPQGCGAILQDGDRVLLRMETIEEEEVAQLVGDIKRRKKKSMGDVVEVSDNVTEDDLKK